MFFFTIVGSDNYGSSPPKITGTLRLPQRASDAKRYKSSFKAEKTYLPMIEAVNFAREKNLPQT